MSFVHNGDRQYTVDPTGHRLNVTLDSYNIIMTDPDDDASVKIPLHDIGPVQGFLSRATTQSDLSLRYTKDDLTIKITTGLYERHVVLSSTVDEPNLVVLTLSDFIEVLEWAYDLVL